MLDAFGGFVDGEETLEQSLVREMKEELNLEPTDYSTPRFLASAIGKYPYGGETITVLSSLFWARLSPDAKPTPQDDVAAIHISAIDDVDPARLHDDDIRNGFIKLKEVLAATYSVL
jgi:ADP-ribose pyrophosphatase YjhB (NUDIX family)